MALKRGCRGEQKDDEVLKKKSTYKVVESSYLGEKAISLYIFGIGVRRGTPVTLSGILCEIT